MFLKFSKFVRKFDAQKTGNAIVSCQGHRSKTFFLLFLGAKTIEFLFVLDCHFRFSLLCRYWKCVADSIKLCLLLSVDHRIVEICMTWFCCFLLSLQVYVLPFFFVCCTKCSSKF